MNPLKAPLHIQILVALIAGAIIGVLVNPGDVEFPEPTRVEIEQFEGHIHVTELAKSGIGQERPVFPTLHLTPDQFVRRYPFIEVPEGGNLQGIDQSIAVTDQRFRVFEDSTGISVSYTRNYNGNPLLTNDHFDTRAELAHKYPLFLPTYDGYRKSTSRTVTIVAKWVGDLFLSLLKMVTIPLIVSSLITGVTGLGGTGKLGSMFSKTLGYYVVTSFLAITTGIIMVNIIRPGVGAVIPGAGETTHLGTDQSLPGIFAGLVNQMIPANPVAALANGEFLSIITFSILFAIFILRAGDAARETLTNFFSAFFEAIMGLTMFVIHLAPIGVLAFMTYATASQGLDIFLTLAWYMLTVFLALLVHATVTMPLLLKFVAGRSPWEYFRALSPALMTAFSTASSNGTLPLTMTCVEKNAGVSNRTSSFVLPLGATINMDGTALYEAVAVLFIAQATAGFELSLSTQIIVAVTALLASVGAAGIPHAGLVMMAIVLQAVGLPLDAQGVIIAVDRVLDMCRTTVNVWSDSCGCAVIEKLTSEENTPITETA